MSLSACFTKASVFGLALSLPLPALCAPPPPAPQVANTRAVEFTHNESIMLVDPARGTISYKVPKRSISKTVGEGDVVFQGRPWNSKDPSATIEGTAFTFKKGCAPAPYRVIGTTSYAGQAITLEGAAPVRDKRSCAIKGYSATSGNAHLEFWQVMPEAKPWTGSYVGECRDHDSRFQCFMEIDNDGKMLDVKLRVAGPMGDNEVKCRLAGKFAVPSGPNASGELNDLKNVRFRLDGGSVRISGIPMQACWVKLSGLYQQYGDL